MTTYFPKIDDNEEYKSSSIVFEKTKTVAASRDYELGYWMGSFMRLFSPGVYFRACDVFGKLENWMELRYLMEHATYDPQHPLYSLDYETCTDEERSRLDVFREIAWSCCYLWYVILKRDRPNLLPKNDRTPLTKQEEKHLRWMEAYYANTRTVQERRAFSNLYCGKIREIYAPKTPTKEEVEIFNIWETEYNRQAEQKRRQERRLEARRRESERMSKLPSKVYIAAHHCIKKQFREVFGKDNKIVHIHHPFELGDLEYRGKLPAAKELVVLLGNEVRSHLLLYYISTHFHGDISVINIVGRDEDIFPLSFDNNELRESCKNPVRLSKGRIKELRNEFAKLKATSSKFFRLEGVSICPLSRQEVYGHILRYFKEGENWLCDVLANSMGYAPKGWSKLCSFYFNCIIDLIKAGEIRLKRNEEVFNGRNIPHMRWVKLADNHAENNNSFMSTEEFVEKYSRLWDHYLKRVYADRRNELTKG